MFILSERLGRLLAGAPECGPGRDDSGLLARERPIEDPEVGDTAPREVPIDPLSFAERDGATQLQRTFRKAAPEHLREILTPPGFQTFTVAVDRHARALSGAVVGDHDMCPLALGGGLHGRAR